MALLRFAKYFGLAVATGSGATAATVIIGGDDVGLVRFGRAASTGGGVITDYLRTMRKYSKDQPGYAEIMSQLHWRSAEKLRTLCCLNGGCFIKVGQHVGSLDYLLPREYVDTMKVLHDRAPQSPLPDVLKVIEEDLGVKASELFLTFDEVPLGTASLAQVHKATLKDGTTVAVKVQHPKVREHSFVDINTMQILTKTAAWVFPDFKFVWLAEETKLNLPMELDFEFEGKNAERVSHMFGSVPFLKVPKIFWNLSSKRVLTMEFCEGGKVDDREYLLSHGISAEEVSDKLCQLYSQMIFEQGFVHCDPHPGNVLINKQQDGSTQIVLLDHGLYTTLTDEFRLNYSKLWMSIIRGDIEGIRHYSESLNCGELYGLFSCMVAGRSWSSIKGGALMKGARQPNEDEQIQENAAGLIPEMVDVLNKVPREMLLIFKTNDCLRGIDSRLKTRFRGNAFASTYRSAVKVVHADRLKNAHSHWEALKIRLLTVFTLLSIDLGVWFLRLVSRFRAADNL